MGLLKPETTGHALLREHEEHLADMFARAHERNEIVADRLAALEAEQSTLKILKEMVP